MIRNRVNIILWPITAFVVLASSISIAFCSPIFHQDGCQVNKGFVSVFTILVTLFALVRVSTYYRFFNDKVSLGYGVSGFFLGILSILMIFFAPGLGLMLGVVGIMASLKQLQMFSSLIAKEALVLSSIGTIISLFRVSYLIYLFFL